MDSKNTATKKNDIVKLNVGGWKYDTTRSTLGVGSTCNFFTRMLDDDDTGRIPCERDEEGRIFIDRDGRTFEGVLNYMRSRKILDKTDTKRRKVEFDFYGIGIGESSPENRRASELTEKIEDLCTNKKKITTCGEGVVKELDLMQKIEHPGGGDLEYFTTVPDEDVISFLKALSKLMDKTTHEKWFYETNKFEKIESVEDLVSRFKSKQEAITLIQAFNFVFQWHKSI